MKERKLDYLDYLFEKKIASHNYYLLMSKLGNPFVAPFYLILFLYELETFYTA